MLKNPNHSFEKLRVPNVHSGAFYSSQDMEAASVSTDRRLDEDDVSHTHTHTRTHMHMHTGISAKRGNEILLFAAIWMDPEGIMLSDVDGMEKDE